MARVNIYVPDDFKDDLSTLKKELKEGTNTSLSDWFVARAREELSRRRSVMESMTGEINVDAVVRRLKVTKDDEASDDFENGKRLGRAWAAHTAPVSELRTMAEQQMLEGHSDHWWGVFLDGYPSLREWEENLKYEGGEEYAMFLRILEDNDRQESFCEGFMKGAEHVWELVEDRL